MLKVNVRRLVEKKYGEKRDVNVKEVFRTADGFGGSESFQVRQGFDSKIDKYTQCADELKDLQAGKFLEGEYVAVSADEKVRLTKLVFINERNSTYVTYINSHYYRYMKKQGLEIRGNSEYDSIIGVKDGEPKVLCFAVRVRDNHFDEQETIEEYKVRVEKEKQQKERRKEIEAIEDREYAERTIKEFINSYSQLIGYEIRMTKINDMYMLEFLDEYGNWSIFENMFYYSHSLNAQKRVGKLIMSMMNETDINRLKD